MPAQFSASAEAPAHPLQVSGQYQADIAKLHPFWPKRRLAFDRAKLERTEEKFDELVADIEEHGIREPLLVDFTYTVLDGHARLQAAQALGLPTVPVRVLWNITKRECHLISMGGPNSAQLQYMELRARLGPMPSPELPEETPSANEASKFVEDADAAPRTLDDDDDDDDGADAAEEVLKKFCHGDSVTSTFPSGARLIRSRRSDDDGEFRASCGRRRATSLSATHQEAAWRCTKCHSARAPPHGRS